MVEFCGGCGTSLPRGDLSFKGGKIFTSPDYVCPSCRKLANPKGGAGDKAAFPEPQMGRDIVIRKGKANVEG